MEQEQANYKIGSIYKRSKFLKSWNKRSIVLNFIKGTLSLRKGKASKEKVLHLQNFEVAWMGNTKSKVYYFKVKAVKNFSQEKYKRVNLGDTDEANARMWMEQIEHIINNTYIAQAPQNLSLPNPASKTQNGENQPPVSKQAQQQNIMDKKNTSEKKITEISPQYAPGRQVLSVNKEEDYDQVMKQFESCCQYGENNASEYDEWKPHEKGVVLPDFNSTFLCTMPDAIEDDPGIENICKNAPESIRADVQIVLEAYFKKRKHFIEACISKIGFKEASKNIYFKEGISYLIQDIPDMRPIEIYEEMQTPSTNEHWNDVIDSYSIQPVDSQNDDNRNLSLISYKFKFDKGNGNIVDKEILAYRYSVQFANGYFMWEFQHLKKQIDQKIENNLINKVFNAAVIFSDPSRNNVSYICMKSDFKFKNESEESQLFNTQRYLKGFAHINKCKDVENLADGIVVECNAEQEDGEDPDEIDSHVFISVRIDRKVTTGNAEEDFTDEEVSAILMKLVNKAYITDCIKAKHERRIVSGVYPLVKTTKEKGHYCFKNDYKREEKRGGLNYYNDKLVKEQRAVLMSIIKRIGSNLLNGRSIMNVSMPVQIFDSKTMIQRLAKGFGHAPTFLEKGGLINSSIEQVKYAAAFLLSSFIMGIGQEKPFNPIIGETVQARINGCPIYFEQTAHHPAISSYIMFGRGYDLYGCHIPVVNMSPNSLQGVLQGNPTIRFKNTNTKVMCIWNTFTMYNLTIGQRYLNSTGRAYIFEPKNCLVLEIIYNPNNASGISSLFSKKYAIDEIQGALYRVKPEVIPRFLAAHKTFGKKTDLQIDPQNDVVKFISKAEGIWNNFLEFDGVRYWDDNKDFPYVCEYEINPLPSDSRYREDMLYFQKNDKKKSQDRKEEMEEAQRYDQKLRELYKKKRENEKK